MSEVHIVPETEPSPEPTTEHELGEHGAHIEQLQTRVEELVHEVDATKELIGDHTTNHPEVLAPIDVVDHSLYVTKEELEAKITELTESLVPPAPPAPDVPPVPDQAPKSRESSGAFSKLADWFYK